MHRQSARRWGPIVPSAVAFLVVLVFAPSLENAFVDWDDPINFTDNHAFRGLGASQLKWCWTTSLLGVYQPVSWMFAGLVYALAGVRPVAFHAVSLALHTASAVVFCLVVVRLLRLAMPGRAAESEAGLWLSAGLAAAVFAVHPLRAETVAWATCQPYALAVLLSLLTVLTYLKGQAPAGRRHWWLAGSVVLCVLAMLSKAAAMSLPVVLLVLDVYPLRRLGASGGGWTGRSARAVYAEKLLFVVPAVAVACAAVWASSTMEPVFAVGERDVVRTAAQAAYGLAFGVVKTLVPVGLLPYYPLPAVLNPHEARFVLSGLLVAGATLLAVVLRRRWPGLLAAWVVCVAIVAPTAGIVQHGLQLAADRYTYLSCLGWAVLLGAGSLRCWPLRPGMFGNAPRPERHRFAWSSPRAQRAVVSPHRGLGGFAGWGLVFGAVVAVAGLAYLSRGQVRVWHDSRTLWSYAVEANPGCYFSHRCLAKVLADEGHDAEAIARYERAIELHPGYVTAHRDLGLVLLKSGRADEAIACFRKALTISPGDSKAHNNLGVALKAKGRLDEAIEHYRAALQTRPAFPEALNNLANALAALGKLEEAEGYYRSAIGADPAYAEAHNNLGLVLLRLGRVEEAIESLTRAVHLRPEYREAWHNLNYARGLKR